MIPLPHSVTARAGGLPPEGPCVEVWQVPVVATYRQLAAAGTSWLSPGEQLRAARFQQAADRQRFLVGRIAARLLGARLLARPPGELPILQHGWSKPVFAGVGEALDFNLSHSGDYCLLAFGRWARVGVDIEVWRPAVDVLALAREHFADDEAEFVLRGPTSTAARRFHDCWTLKEACLKAAGLGLAGDLKGFTVVAAATAAGRGTTIIGPGASGRWNLMLLQPHGADQSAAVCWSGDDRMAPVYHAGAETQAVLENWLATHT